ncbi:ser thr protein kinase [Vairimorpha apis BRL 01]|uniref:Ser thr protein kinase n=1 Tax=Vairimorpha apis BRL 01 TaxID=1037528 RepID=T0L669_9MICR|nr:ser thr protein kinase [Vairimorpha apis BRL 01]
MTKRKLFTLKQDYQDKLFSTPKTPCKQVYKDMLDSSVIIDTSLPEDIFNTKIGEGDFYTVFLTNKKTALKKSKNTVNVNLYKKEVEILKMLKNEFCIKYVNDYTYNKVYYIELEYCNKGTLRDCINKTYYTEKSKFSQSLITFIMKSIINGLKYLKSLNIVHLDIKPENIFVHNDTYKIGDFNISRFEGETIDYDGDKRYMAIEVLDGICTCASDVYSCGLIYLEILKGINLPLKGESWVKLRKDDFKGIKVNKIIRKMLKSDYKKRISASEVLDEI